MQRRTRSRVSFSLFLILAAGCTGKAGGGGGGEDEAGTDELPNEEPGEPAKSVCGGQAMASSGKWRRLTAGQYANTIRDLFGPMPEASFVSDTRTGPFKTNAALPIQENDVGSYAASASAIATKAVSDLGRLLDGCDTRASAGEEKCAKQFIVSMGLRMFRRPLKPEEEADFSQVFAVGKEESFAVGIRLVIEAMLQAPSFIYLAESKGQSGEGTKLTGYEVATRLSYLFTGSMPDAQLFEDAKAGKLDTAAGIRETAMRLLDSELFTEQVADFHEQLLGADDLLDTSLVTKAPKYGSFDEAIRLAMIKETNDYVRYVMAKGSGSVEELLSANYVFPTGALTKVYGSDATPDSDGRVVIDDGTRAGLLTLAANLAVHPKQYSPSAAVNRGHMVRRDFLCQLVPPPDVAVDFSPPPGAENMTAQQRLREHQQNPTCSGCHRLMDSIGFGFESYDAVGTYRTKDDGGNSIDSSGEITDIMADGHFANAREMAEILAKSPEVRSCMSVQWFRYALARDPDDADACTQERVQRALAEGGGNIKQAVLSLVTSDSFRLNGGK